jgi:transposase-like protein
MSKKRRRFSAEYKFRVALEAAQGQQTIGELASRHNLHPTQISQWKRQLLAGGADVFNGNGAKEQANQEVVQAELYEQIGRLKMELEWLKKKAAPFA